MSREYAVAVATISARSVCPPGAVMFSVSVTMLPLLMP
jgi:hypothetical protein